MEVSAETRDVSEILRDWFRFTSEILVDAEHQPISNLAWAILSGSFECGEALKPHLNTTTQEKKSGLYQKVCYEFIYFYAHLMNRYALSILGEDGRTKLLDKIAPLIVVPAVSAFYNHWPNEMKQKMEDSFQDDLNIAELAYSFCRELYPTSIQVLFKESLDDLENSSAKSCFSKLISRIFTLLEKSPSPEALALLVWDISTKTFIDMKLKQQIEEIKKIL